MSKRRRRCRPTIQGLQGPQGRDLSRAVTDYIAGMTDRYALREHQRLTGRRLFDV